MTVPLDPAHLVGVGGALGAIARHGVNRAVDADAFPLGTLSVNVLGSFALGLLAFAGAGEDLTLFLGVGACGSFTTFSSFSFETVRLFEDDAHVRGVVNAVSNLLGALLAVGLAWLLVAAI